MAEQDRQRIRLRLGVILFLLCGTSAGLIAVWHLEIEPGLLWHRSLGQVSVMQTGVMLYNETHTNPASSIEALVKAKKLPEVSSIYASPLRFQKQKPKPVSYADSDYEIVIEGTDTVIRLKPAILNHVAQVWRLRKLNYHAIGARVGIDDRVVYAPDPLKEEGR